MPLYKTLPISGGILGVWQLTETSDELLPFSSPEETSSPQYRKYTFEKRKAEYLATRVIIQELAGPDFTISYLDSGKPVLTHAKYKYIAISHSREFVVVILHETLDVGIDIESINRNYTAIGKRYLSEQELIQVNNIDLLYCLYWCAKEAVFKLVPEDGVEFREQIYISAFNPEEENQFSIQFISAEKETIYQSHFQIFAGHCMVWLTENKKIFLDSGFEIPVTNA